NAMQQWADAQRGTPRIRLRITDVGGSDAKLLVELKRAADAGDADAFVVGVPATIDDALSSAIALVKRPVLFTLPIAEPSGDGAPRPAAHRPRGRRRAGPRVPLVSHRRERREPPRRRRRRGAVARLAPSDQLGSGNARGHRDRRARAPFRGRRPGGSRADAV